MNKKLIFFALIFFVIGLLLPFEKGLSGSAQAARGGKGTTITIAPDTIYVSDFEGWGTSLVWFANVTGGWSDNSRNALADFIFGAKGLGMNIARYNIGGSSATQPGMRPGGLVRSYINADGTYDWTVDANQRWWLSAAAARGANIAEAFSNSPPWFMTVSGDSRGAEDCSDNLLSSQDGAFADYLTEVVKHFRNDWGITFRTLEPFNEPSATWWCSTSSSQEGANISVPHQIEVLQKTGASLADKGLTSTKLSAPDEGEPKYTVSTLNGYSNAAMDYIDQINSHTYWGTAEEKTILSNLGINLGKRMWMSEVDGSGGSKHSHTDIAPGLWLAAKITEDINYLKPAAWIFWQVIEDEDHMVDINQNWGLIHADMAGSSEAYYVTKKFYVMGNYTRFIRPGYEIISSGGDENSVAAYNPSTKTLVIVTYNEKPRVVSMRYDLTNFTTTGGSARSYRTSATENLARSSNINISKNTLTTLLPAKSVTTFVINGITK